MSLMNMRLIFNEKLVKKSTKQEIYVISLGIKNQKSQEIPTYRNSFVLSSRFVITPQIRRS